MHKDSYKDENIKLDFFLPEHLPRLQPRPYSVCSSPLISQGKISCVFNVVETTAENGRTYFRKGVCTGWLDGMTRSQQKSGQSVDSVEKDIVIGVSQMELSSVKVFGKLFL